MVVLVLVVLYFTRVVALAGDVIESKDREWRRNDEAIKTRETGPTTYWDHAYEADKWYESSAIGFERRDEGKSYTVVRDADYALDPAFANFGPVPLDAIVGKATSFGWALGRDGLSFARFGHPVSP